jgi:hypothetical protein
MGALRTAAVVLAALILLILVLTILLVFIGLHRMSEYYAMFVTVRTPRIKMTDLYDHLKTGDLLLFVATTNAGTNSMLTQTFYSHGAVVLREGELVYASETQAGAEIMPDPADPTRKDIKLEPHVSLTPLLTRLKYYTGACYVVRLSRALDPEREEILKREAERLCVEKYPYPSLFQSFLGIFGWRTATRHCFQHVAHLLDKARLTPLGQKEPLAAASFLDVCEEVITLPGRPLPDGYAYEPPVQILYDVGAITP